jgi:hypothetical protein
MSFKIGDFVVSQEFELCIGNIVFLRGIPTIITSEIIEIANNNSKFLRKHECH